MRDTLFEDICAIIKRDFISFLKRLNETDFLLKLLRAIIEPYVSEDVIISVMKRFNKGVFKIYPLNDLNETLCV